MNETIAMYISYWLGSGILLLIVMAISEWVAPAKNGITLGDVMTATLLCLVGGPIMWAMFILALIGEGFEKASNIQIRGPQK